MFFPPCIFLFLNFPNINTKRIRIADAVISTIGFLKIISYFFIYLHNILIMTETKNPTKLGNNIELLLIKRVIEL